MSAIMTEWLKTPTGTMSLRKEQAWALAEIAEVEGLFGPIGVGVGKSILTLLAPTVLEAQRPLLILPAATRDEKTIKKDIPELAAHWRLHPRFIQAMFDVEARKECILSYEELSRDSQADAFQRIKPDLIVLDECHRAKNKQSAVWRRIERYFLDYPGTKMVAVSGTITTKSLRDYAHLAKLCLKDKSPLPHRWADLEDWADALDEGVDPDQRPDPGALELFCKAGDTPRQGFRRRLLETKGVVATESPSSQASITISELPVSPPLVVREAFEKMRSEWLTPGGDIIMTALELAAHLMELACGFYYRWKWANGVVDQEWLDALTPNDAALRATSRSSCQAPARSTASSSTPSSRWRRPARRADCARLSMSTTCGAISGAEASLRRSRSGSASTWWTSASRG